MSGSLIIEDVGAIERVEIPCPEEGGLVIFTGSPGIGKSTALKAINALGRRDESLPKRDGATTGQVVGFGVTIKIGKSTRRTGKAEVEFADEKFPVASLVDPGIDDPLRADAKRIRDLVTLAGVEPDLEAFATLFSGPSEFLQVVGDVQDEAGRDLVEMAALVKKKIEAAARTAEQAGTAARSKQAAIEQTAGNGGQDGTVPDAAALQGMLEAAIRSEAELKSQAASGKKTLEAAAEARAVLAKTRTESNRPTLQAVKERVAAAQKQVRQTEDALAAAKEAARCASVEESAALQAIRDAEAHEVNLNRWQATIEQSANVVVPSDADLSDAAQAVAAAHDNIRIATERRKQLEDQRRAKAFRDEAQKHEAKADRLRGAAKRTDEILAEAVAKLNCPLRVKHGRLVLTTDRSPDELFADLSQGEKIKTVVTIAADFIPGGSPLTIPQDFFGELPPSVRRLLNDVLKSRRIVCYTAQVTDEPELKAELFNGSHA